MRATVLLLLMFIAGAFRSDGQQVQAVTAVAPTPAELGRGWVCKSVVTLADRYSHLAEVGLEPKRVSDQMLRSEARSTRGVGFGKFLYARGNSDYSVSIQRCESTNALEGTWEKVKARYGTSAHSCSDIGEDAFWAATDIGVRSLAFKQGRFFVTISGNGPVDQPSLSRLAQVIDAKLRGRPVPDVPDREDVEPQQSVHPKFDPGALFWPSKEDEAKP